MKLLLTSNGISNPSIDQALQELLQKPYSECKLVFIPTAANVETGDKSWVEDDIRSFKKLGFMVDVLDIASVKPEIWTPRVENADVLVFGGGSNAYLANCLEESGLKALLPGLLTTRLYIGISAGSCVAGILSTRVNENIYDEKEKYTVKEPGLNYVNFVFMPHLNSDYFPKVGKKHLDKLAKEIKEPIYALDDQSAIKIDGDNLEIVSEGEWVKYN